MHPRLAPDQSTRDALRIGVGVGATIFSLYLVAGYVVADWSIQDFLAHLTPDTVVWLALAGGIAIAVFAIPVAAYIRLRVVSPLLVLGLLLVGWIGLGIGQGIPLMAVFGLSYYALGLSPVYILVYLVAGGIEYRIRN